MQPRNVSAVVILINRLEILLATMAANLFWCADVFISHSATGTICIAPMPEEYRGRKLLSYEGGLLLLDVLPRIAPASKRVCLSRSDTAKLGQLVATQFAAGQWFECGAVLIND